jgi:hypothetical protein
LAVLSADAAGLGAETVDEPWEFGKSGHLEDCEAAAFAFNPVLIGSGGRDRRECPSYGIAALAPALQCFRG